MTDEWVKYIKYKGASNWLYLLAEKISAWENRYVKDAEIFELLNITNWYARSSAVGLFYERLNSGEINIEGLLGPHGYALYQALKVRRAAEKEKERAKHMEV